MSGDAATPLSAAELERLLREPRRPAPRQRIAVSATSLAALARQPGLVDRLLARYRFTGEDRARGEPMLGFETLTFAPIERELIEPALLTEEERRWLDAYHAKVLEVLGPQLSPEERVWLEAKCRPITAR